MSGHRAVNTKSDSRLLVDIGNTRVKYSRDQPVLSVLSVVSVENLPVADICELRVASVAGLTDELNTLALRHNCSLKIAKVRRYCHGLQIAYPDERRLGVDRWLAMLAVWYEKREAFCVIDIGTAITVDYVDDNGCHQGGYIVPGYELMQRSLGLHTHQVGYAPIVESGSLSLSPGKDTESCVQAGLARMIRAFIADIVSTLPEGKLCLLTGGGSSCIPMNAAFDRVIRDESLVLRGLRYCFE